MMGHAPRGACELKSLTLDLLPASAGVTPREVRVSLNLVVRVLAIVQNRHAPRGACELKCIIRWAFFRK